MVERKLIGLEADDVDYIEVVTTKYKMITTKDILGLNIVMKDGTDYAYRG